jgi:membrane fusion protein (multidrug efflux system)
MSTPGPTPPDSGGQVASATEPEPAPSAATNATPAAPAPVASRSKRARKWLLWAIGLLVLAFAVKTGVPWAIRSWNTVSTDDAYVDGHVTFVAARVPGQVERVLVDDDNRVHKGDLLVQLDKEPYQVQVNIAEAAVEAARAQLLTARAEARSTEGRARSLRFNLQRSIEDVNNQIALLRARVAALQLQKASLAKTQVDYRRAKRLVETGAISKEEFDVRNEALLVDEARVEEALQGVYQIRVALGLPPKPEGTDDLAQVPADLAQTFSSVKQAQMSLIQAVATIGVALPGSFTESPQQMIAQFYKLDASGDINRILAKLLDDAPSIKRAEAALLEAERDLDKAKLNLRYCDVIAEIDGVITRRNVNPGNNVVAGQSLMAVRSLTDIWVDANFKETQLAKLRIGQAVDLDVDMYGSRVRFKGRISGFTMGTGSTLALLPAENATGNFVKVVQRLPVRIDLIDYDPDKTPLFVGLSVTPYVRVNEPPTGPNAGKVLQPYLPTTAPGIGAGKQL